MSLFEDSRYRWRETYFVLFKQDNCPTAEAVATALRGLELGYEVTDTRPSDDSPFESLTVKSELDFAAMDISYVVGEEVTEQIAELKLELRESVASQQERSKLEQLSQFDARFDVYHFEQQVDDQFADDDEFLDPGSLLLVLQKLAKLCHGVAVDPQSGTLM